MITAIFLCFAFLIKYNLFSKKRFCQGVSHHVTSSTLPYLQKNSYKQTMSKPFCIVDWQDHQVIFLDQRLLPEKESYITCSSVEDVARAICNMTVRGAPALGVAAAMGLALAAQNSKAGNFSEFLNEVESAAAVLFNTRPTAVNLCWALERIKNFTRDHRNTPLADLKNKVLAEAITIKNEDIAANRRIGQFGQVLLRDGDTVLTHCNAGALCSAGFGTALGVIYAAREAGKNISVIADETRPVLQGARLTAWELTQNGVPVTVISDNMAGHIMAKGLVKQVIVGADRIAANGDTANKIGTYSVAILAKYHGIPFYVAAPSSTVDLSLSSGQNIPIEQRHENEIRIYNDKIVVPDSAKVLNPAFDITPHELITAIITDQGIAKPNFTKNLPAVLQSIPSKKII